jgi:hypothetical protein
VWVLLCCWLPLLLCLLQGYLQQLAVLLLCSSCLG